MRCTERSDTPVAAATARPVQCVASPGGSSSVSSTTRSTSADGNGGKPGFLVFSRNRPGAPSRMNRSCQRHTHGFETPARRMISAVPHPSAVARMIRARQTCFCGLLRSATTAANRSRSAALTSMLIPSRMPHHTKWHAYMESYDCVGPLVVAYPDRRRLADTWVDVRRRCLRATFGTIILYQFAFAEGHGASTGWPLQSREYAVNHPSLPEIALSSCPLGQPDGRTDNSVCVQSMVDSACHTDGHRGGGLVLLWPGHWKFHDITIHCDGVHVKGTGSGNDSMRSNAQSTSVDCSDMTNHCIQFIPEGFPAQYRIRGGSVEGIRFFNSRSSGRILDFVQVEDGYARDISMWEPASGIRLYGVLTFSLTHIREWGARGAQYEIMGDLSGKASNGKACTLGDCSTR